MKSTTDLSLYIIVIIQNESTSIMLNVGITFQKVKTYFVYFIHQAAK